MYLKSLEISGFKSFAKKEKLDFDTPISAIVGPNGSGKSNIAEAFRFVLGEQSIKSMRGKRGEDLIFNGSQSVPRSNRAEVKIVFDNSSRFLDIDFDSVELKRAVSRDGTNQYFINNSPVRLRDITELLAGANIGLTGHHIISQGEADRILNVNDRERRAIIEDALGLKIFQYKRLASEKKLSRVRENIETVQSLRRENAPHLKFLKRQVAKLEKSLQMREELKTLYQKYFKRENIYLKYWTEKIAKEKKPLLDNLGDLEKKSQDAQTILENFQQPLESYPERIALEKKLNETRNQKSELTRALGRTEGIISALRITPAEPQPTDGGDTMVNLAEIKELEVTLTAQIELAEKLEDSNQIKGILKRIKDILAQFLVKFSNLDIVCPNEEKTFGHSMSKLGELEKEKDNLEKELAEVEIKENEILTRYNAFQQKLEKEKDSNKDAELAVFEISAQRSEVKTRLNSLQNLEEKITDTDANYKKELNEAYVLAGREITQFDALELKDDATGQILNQTEIVAEARAKQTDRLKIIERIKIQIEELGGGSGEEIIKEHTEAETRDAFLAGEITDLEQTAQSLLVLIQELKEKIDTEFKSGLLKINEQFKIFFILMFGGGRANLNLVKEISTRRKSETNLDIDDEILIEEMENTEEAEEGIEVDISLPNKKIKGLQMLSGGERSLTSIALLFAMSQVTPPPFIILDETDAALDEANSKKYGDMVENLARQSQLILITHNRETMSRANILYGITMGVATGVSKLLSVKFDEAVQVAK